jgi:glucose/arabinose dehydrogenase
MSFARPTIAAFAAAFFILPSARTEVHPPAKQVHVAKPECAADNGGLTLPRGFCAFIVAEKLTTPRHLIVMPNGDLFVSSSRSGVIALRDTTGDGKADIVQEWGGGIHSSEVAIRNGYLYSDASTSIVRYPIQNGSLTASGPVETFIGGLPPGGHAAKTFALADDGTMYVNIGSRTNSCQEKDRQLESPGADPCVERETRAGIWAFKTDRSGQTAADGVHFGTGIRNSVSITINPVDKTLYVMQHGRDQLAQNWPKLFDEAKSAETPAEEMFHVTKGDDFGWPYCYFDRQQGKKLMAPEYGGDGKTVGRCVSYKGNVASFPGHWAPNALAFYTGKSFPDHYHNGAFIAFHGSWNRAPLPQEGYNVVFQPMANGKASGRYEIFADGFRPATPGATGTAHRPTGLAVGPDGSLYITDDAAGTIWRVMYTGK